MTSPIQVQNHGDGTYTVTYFGRVAGYISRIRVKTADGVKYRAVSVHNDVRHFFSISGARAFVLENAW
jgi:hypothetical protein